VGLDFLTQNLLKSNNAPKVIGSMLLTPQPDLLATDNSLREIIPNMRRNSVVRRIFGVANVSWWGYYLILYQAQWFLEGFHMVTHTSGGIYAN
jgi:hypothetical protein